MNYAEALNWLYGLSARGVRLELDRMRGGLAYRGHPQRGLAVVHVAGSNGKGSVTAMVERILREAGYRTGMFTSPHLHRFVERVRIAGRPLSEAEVARRLSDQRAVAAAMPSLTFFEHTALMAFEAFRDHGCDVCVVEVGLGGRLDATNVFDAPLVSVITSISLDHRKILGGTIAAIAREKGGILRRGRPAVIGARDPAARRVLLGMARRRGCDPWSIGRQFDAEAVADGARIRVGAREFERRLGLAGLYQAQNAAIAVAAIERLREGGWSVEEEAIGRGLRRARWPGRMERLRSSVGQPEMWVDCAHNPEGCEALAAHLRSLPPKKTVLLFGALRDKPLGPMLAAFDDLVDRRVYAVPRIHRAPPTAQTYADIRSGTVARSVRDGLARALRMAGPDGRLVVAGSIFLVNEARAQLLGVRTDPPIAM